jgi:hypothetical protein
MDLITAAVDRMVSYRPGDLCHSRLTVYAVSVAGGSVFAAGFPDDPGEASRARIGSVRNYTLRFSNASNEGRTIPETVMANTAKTPFRECAKVQ